MENVISPVNKQFVERAIRYISAKHQIKNYRNMLWVAYGSYVINMNRLGSDLDVLAIHSKNDAIIKITDDFENVPIHFMSLSDHILKDDGKERMYGAYITGKIINPHIFLYGNQKLRKTALLHSGQCIGPLAGYLSRQSAHIHLSDSAITALVFISYLSTDPSFDSYFLHYFLSPSFSKLWRSLINTTIEMLQTAGEIKESKGIYMFTNPFKDYQSFHRERMKISARHWSYGAVCHNSDRTFQDQIYTKAEQKMKLSDPHGIKYKEMVKFLKYESGLSNIYI